MKNRHLTDSFRCAFRGIFQALKTEKNFKLHLLAMIIVMLMAWYFHLSTGEYLVLIITVLLVIITELLNTAIEYTVDLVCGNRYSELAKYAKDIAAGATLLAALGSVIIGCIIFLPKIIERYMG
ncbi:diacylglycerol kinase family protein [Vallitalea pronyensis]|uniref:Diacylglycerol kinase family protein n=1 Tax=Vallitalea pronyensis TaxID=1348613 RepID=A0A8J8SH60_9FIRM|nr:diacylglycerol kinase family protein [Vallitalea pronyensis]QUI23530.1 diacylglycerol kinase family protein [Vallitalea pronyensis]